MKKPNKIKRNDYNRILITETLPHETPIIFSNDGLYDRIAGYAKSNTIQQGLIKTLVFAEGLSKPPNSTIPYTYKIRKNSLELRRLALLHPMSQWKLKCFYQKYEKLILHYCSISSTSIRSPDGIAGSFYNKSSWENVNKYKKGNIALTSTEKFSKHSPSFFSYRGHDRLHKFFSSKDFYSLEKKFPSMSTLDVSKCFDSIYTHSLSWAVKDKHFTKTNVDVSATFGQEFDTAIRHGNHNETNGIPIGPEASRIFSEILFQEIDRQTILAANAYEFDVDYTFRRYVDDVFIFARNDEVAADIYATYADILTSFNLHANTGKRQQMRRPFLTIKSRLINGAKDQTTEFLEKFLSEDAKLNLEPTKIFSTSKLVRNYIESIKSLCSYNSANYDDVSSFLISILTERIKKIVSVNLEDANEEAIDNYTTAILVILEALFFLYSVAPSVSASYKVSTSIILSIRFADEYLGESKHSISQRIYELSADLLIGECSRIRSTNTNAFIRLEILNIALAARELGENYLFPRELLNNLFMADKKLTYFTIISGLFYIKDDEQYHEIRNHIISLVVGKLKVLSDLAMNSEKAHLLLDMLSCPYIPNSLKTQWTRTALKALGLPAATAAELTSFIKGSTTQQWQVNWKDVDLLNSLEKKELKQAYS